MGVAITIFTYFGDDEETLSARFYGVKKAFCEAFKGDISIICEADIWLKKDKKLLKGCHIGHPFLCAKKGPIK